MNSTRISILIPVYNRKKYIEECIQSALNQTFSDFEIVIVDNASDDGTWETCQEYAARDSRVRIFRNETNIGPVRNWIRCAQEARGECSKILFSDDLLEPDCVERMLQPLKNSNVGLVFCAANIGTSKELSVLAYSVNDKSLLDWRKYLTLLLSGRVPVSPGAVMLRTQDLIKNLHTNFATSTPRPFDRHGAGPDVMISLLTASSYPCVACVKDPLVFFRAHPGSFSISNTNNEVTNGYISAISYYLRHNEGWFSWINYLACTWISELRRQQCWINPRLFLRANEGTGAMVEIFFGFVFVPFHIARKLARRINQR